MKTKVIRSCVIEQGGACDFIYLMKETREDGSQAYIVDDHYTYTTRAGERISDYSTSTRYYDRDIAIAAYNAIIKVWL